MRAVHYVGFRDDRYWSAYRIWGGPRFIHRGWDTRARRDIGPDDIVIFANGDWTQPTARFTFHDLDEKFLLVDK
jgi:hypothetical protein